jgi:glycosyltransferase involved in cell wall biosynthesis
MVENSPLVTIIVPVFNGENFLGDCLESIKRQTFHDFEVLVIDDGSRNSQYADVCVQELHDNRFKVFHKSNGGVASALNFGIEMAQGRYFMWLSHDDMWLPRKIEASLRHHVEGTITCSNYQLIDTDGIVTAETHFEKEFNVNNSLMLVSRGLVNGCSIFTDMSLIRSLDGFDVTLLHTQDYALWLKALRQGIVFRFDRSAFVQTRLHSAQSSKLMDPNFELNVLWREIVQYWIEVINAEQLQFQQKLVEVDSYLSYLDGASLSYAYEILKSYEIEIINSFSVTVIIPVKDRPYQIQRSLLSVMSQLHKNCDVIIIDDSKDEHQFAWLNSVSDQISRNPVVTVIKNRLSGVASARNEGIINSTSDYLAFLDSDDYYLPEFLHESIKKLVINDGYFIHADYLESKREGRNGIFVYHDTSHNSGKDILETLGKNCAICTSTVLVQRNAVSSLESSLFRNDLKVGEDSNAWIRLIAINPQKVYHLNQVGSVVSTRSSSSKNDNELVHEVIRRNEELIKSLRSDSSMFSSLSTNPRKMLLIVRHAMFQISFFLYSKIGSPPSMKRNRAARYFLKKIGGI